MPTTDNPEQWITVCVTCRRMKRDGHWTSERAADVSGYSSGFCDRCAKAERARLRREAASPASKVATRLRPNGPLSE